jgi:hypothetical protein
MVGRPFAGAVDDRNSEWLMVELARVAPHEDAFQFSFDPSLLAPLASIYENVVAPKLDFARLRSGAAHDKLHGDGLRFHVSRYGNLLAWVSADNLATHREFGRLFEHLHLADAAKDLIDWHERIVLYNGFYIVSDGVDGPSWHRDYVDGAQAYTLLTPLYELDAEHGQLLYESDGKTARYEYRRGVGVTFGHGFRHATEPFASASRPRVLVSLAFGTDRMRYWPALQRTVGIQAPFVVMPCGHRRGTCGCLQPRRSSAVG